MHPLEVLQRLRGRSPRELAERGTQAARLVLERVGLGADIGPQSPAQALAELSDARGRPFATPEAAHAALTSPGTHRLVPGLVDRASTIAAVEAADPAARARCLAAAERLSAGRFDLLGFEGLSWGTPVDWHLDPVSGRRAPADHWSRIPFLDHAASGDHKVTWEINRHQWLVTLAQAWWFTQDERWAELALAHIDHWIAENPSKRGINWASSLEIAFRSVSWIWTLQLLHGSRALTPERHVRALGVLARGARHVEQNLSTWFSPNTHLTGEALALFSIGCGVPALRGATRWRTLGGEILAEWMPHHVLSDGTYVEQSTWYARYTADFLVHGIVIGEHAGAPIVGAREALDRIATFLLSVMRPDGSYPLIGDDDGGRWDFLDSRSATSLHSTLASAAALLDRADLAWGGGPADDEPRWLLGAASPPASAKRSSQPPVFGSRAFPDGGVYVMRDGWRESASFAVIDCGPHGFRNAGHAHADLLSVDVTLRGRPFLRDPGTFTYTASAQARDEFREAASHATVTVDGHGSSTPSGPFTWASRPTVTEARLLVRPAADAFVGTHDGFTSLPGSPAHRRAVVRARGDYWLLLDELRSTGAHELEVHLPLAAGLTADPASGDVHEHGALIARVKSADSPSRWRARAAWQSRAYGHREASTTLSQASRADGHQLVATVIAPADAAVVAVERAGADAITVRGEGWTDWVVLSAGDRIVVGDLEVQAAFAWIRRDANSGRLMAALMLGATHLSLHGAPHFVAAGPVPFAAIDAEAAPDGDGWTAAAIASVGAGTVATPS